MLSFTTDRALVAANALVYLAIAFGTLSFWSDAVETGAMVDFVIAGLLTVAFGSVSFLLSGAVIRFSDAKGHKVTRALVILLGAVLVLIEAGMTHQGLAWLDEHKDFAPWWVLLIASFGLSIFNVFSLYVFARDIPAEKPASAGRLLAIERWKDKKAA